MAAAYTVAGTPPEPRPTTRTSQSTSSDTSFSAGGSGAIDQLQRFSEEVEARVVPLLASLEVEACGAHPERDAIEPAATKPAPARKLLRLRFIMIIPPS